MLCNPLHLKTMNSNILPPFIIRESGIEVNDMPNIHIEDKIFEYNKIYMKEAGLRISLQLWGILLLFHTFITAHDEI